MKKATKKSTCCSKATDKIHELEKEVKDLVSKAKKHYDKADEKTKKKVIAGVAGAAALIAGAIGVSKIKNSIKKKKD